MAPATLDPNRGKALASFSRTTNFLRRHLWLRPVLAAIVLVVVGSWERGTVEESMRERMAAEVTTIRDADVVALRFWLKEQQINATLLAEDPALAVPIRAIVAHARQGNETDAKLLQSDDLRL